MRWWLAVALVLGCGDNVVPAAVEPHSGARLKLLRYVYGDGAQEPASTRALYDATRDEVCKIVTWTDGRRRCTPGLPRYDEPLEPRVVYTDDACAHGLGRSSDAVVVLAAGEWRDGVFVPERLYDRSPDAVAAPARTFERRDGACVEAPADGPVAYYWKLGRAHAADELAEVTREAPPSVGRLGPLLDTSADGLVMWVGWYDRLLGVPCGAEQTATGEVCAPREAAVVEYFADPACREPAVVGSTDASAPAVAVSWSARTWCSSYFEVGAAIDGPVCASRPAGCVASPVPDGARAFRVGAPVALAPLAVEIRDRGGRRLAEVVETFGEIESPPRGIYDEVLGSECSARNWFAFDPRCAPMFAYGTLDVFVEPGCTATTEVGLIPEATCAVPSTLVSTRDGLFAELGAPVTHYDGDTCTERSPPPGYTLRALGRRHSHDELARATLRYEE